MDKWRKLLAELIENSAEKKKVAEEVGIGPRTLERWAEGVSKPLNMQHIYKLGQVASRSVPELEDALRTAFPSAFKGQSQFENTGKDVSLEFYYRMMDAHTNVQPGLRRYTFNTLTFLQMIRHLDPNNAGFAVVIAQAVPVDAPENRIHHFVLQNDGGGSSFWDARQVASNEPHIFSIESAVGREIMTGYPHFLQDISLDALPEHTQFLLKREELRSVAVHPIKREGAISGGTICASTQRDFFTAVRKDIVKRYVDLLGLAFYDREFYPVVGS